MRNDCPEVYFEFACGCKSTYAKLKGEKRISDIHCPEHNQPYTAKFMYCSDCLERINLSPTSFGLMRCDDCLRARKVIIQKEYQTNYASKGLKKKDQPVKIIEEQKKLKANGSRTESKLSCEITINSIIFPVKELLAGPVPPVGMSY